MKNVVRQWSRFVCWCIGILLIPFFPFVQNAHGLTNDQITVVGRGTWLQKYGVEVYYAQTYQPDDTRFEAIDLVERLYARRFNYPSDWGVEKGNELVAKVQNGFEDLEFFANGESEAPSIGDVLVWDEHMAIVNEIDDVSVSVVQQAKWTSYDETGNPIGQDSFVLTKSISETYTITGTFGWVRSPHMVRLLDGTLAPKPIVGDWDGDGIDTIGIFDPVRSIFYLKNINTSGGPPDIQFQFGDVLAGWIPLSGDWDADGYDTVGLYDPNTATYYLKNNNTTGLADISLTYGKVSDRCFPVSGDWNRDGMDTVGFYDQSMRFFYLNNSNTSVQDEMAIVYGPRNNTFLPFTGNWNGNNQDTIGLYDSSQYRFLLRNTNDGGIADINIYYDDTRTSWIPIVGDWDGDGIDSTGYYVYNPENRVDSYTFHLNNEYDNIEMDIFADYNLFYILIMFVWF